MKKTMILIIGATTLFYGFRYSDCVERQGEALVPSQKEALKMEEALQGAAWQEVVVEADGASDVEVSTVTYAAGSRHNWHAHPGGQIMMVAEGEGYYQEKGSPKRLLRKGDVVRCLPGLVHWHGAAPNSGLTFTSIEKEVKGRSIDWLEPIGEEEYKAPPKGVAEQKK